MEKRPLRSEPRLLGFGDGIRRPMAGGTIFRRRLIEENGLGSHDFGELVALRAAHVLVGSAQGEGCSLLVVKKRGLPLVTVVAICAGSGVGFSELLSVDVFVTVLALGRRSLEINIDQFRLEVRRLVAIDASRGTMRPNQSEFRF